MNLCLPSYARVNSSEHVFEMTQHEERSKRVQKDERSPGSKAKMGFFIGSSDKQQEDNDMLLYVEDAEVNQTATEPAPVIENEAAENPAELSEIQIIVPRPPTLVPNPTIPEIVIIDDAKSSEIQINVSASSFTVSPSSDRSRARYRCKLCHQIKSGHTCPYKNAGATATPVDDRVPEEPLVGSRTASNRENLSRLAQRVEGDESSDPDWVAPNGNNTPSMRTTPKRSGKRKLTSTTNEREENSTPKRARKTIDYNISHYLKYSVLMQNSVSDEEKP
ncbi:hypothetical protein DAPPUDRAFT_235009 [Daphnia pulex]|uniref:Uncharacterized protein n=1 Tax=Daphnia pulex TaxID=6669 RepID=E9FXZ3_DAPPU|nr:hypothetical protein DAPPUDRAFT_235009 [Daphnia pulex]|eukprot:EFX88185.1 hypothetical protein DAPPUDRAFT_235009 [Daphnia pulex]